MATTRATLEDLIGKISRQLVELDNLAGTPLPHELRGPATEERIAAFERSVGMDLPADYREFLLIHDGWVGFSGEARLFSIAEMGGGEFYDHIQEFQKELRRNRNEGPAEGLVFEGSLGTRMSYFDRKTHREKGSLDVVFWDLGEVERYQSFVEYLIHYAQNLDEMIEAERRNLR